MSEPARYRHWQNRGQGGECVFITTTALDHAHLFSRADQKDALTAGMIDDCIHYGAVLFAYVTMSNHIHLLLRLPEEMDVQRFMARLKRNATSRIEPTLDESQHQMLSIQRGLNGRSCWQRGFRSVRVASDKAMSVKFGYINYNPVRAGLCENPREYRWSSLYAYGNGCRGEHWELNMEKALQLYRPERTD